MLVGHADAAMQLDHLAADEVQRVAGHRLGEADRLVDIRAPGVDRLQRALDRRAHQLQLGEHLRHAVLQRLEGGERLAELDARLEIVVGHLERLLRHAEHLRRRSPRSRDRCTSSSQRRRRPASLSAARAVEARPRHGCANRPCARVARVTPSPRRRPDTARRPPRRRTAPALSPSATNALVPVSLPPATVVGDLRRVVTRPFVDRQRRDHLARWRSAAAMSAFCASASAQHDRARRRRGRRRAAMAVSVRPSCSSTSPSDR